MSNSLTSPDAPVLFECPHENVALVTLNRPNARNAITAEMARLMEDNVRRIEEDASIRVVVIAASGSAFCAGADLKEVAAGRGNELALPGSGFAGFVFARRTKPWIAAVHGAAHGGGTEIALACEMIVAGEAATFGLPEVRRGLLAGAGGCFRIARALPRAVAFEMVTTGVPISSTRAYELGLVNRLSPTEKVLEDALQIAMLIAANSPLSIRESLALTKAAVDLEDERLIRLQQEAITRVLAGPDVIEGATAFLEKRAPIWRS